MGSAASTTKKNYQPQAPSSNLLNGLNSDNIAPESAESKAAQERLQKTAFGSEKSGWKDAYREYNTDRGINKVAQVEWSDEPAPPKQKSFNSSSGGSATGMSLMSQRSKPPTPVAYTNPNVGKASPPPNAGRSPSSHHLEVIQPNGRSAPIAPSSLGTPIAPIDTAPVSYAGGLSQCAQQIAGSSVSSPVGRYGDVNAAQRRSTEGQQNLTPGEGRSPLVGKIKKPLVRRISDASDTTMESSHNLTGPLSSTVSIASSSTTGGKPPPPSGPPPPKHVNRVDSGVDGDGMMADFTNESKAIENAAVSATTPKDMPVLNLVPVAAQAAFRNQPTPKNSKSAYGTKLHNHYNVAKENSSNSNISAKPTSAKPLPNSVPPPSGPVPGSAGQRAASRGGPPAPATPVSSSEVVVKRFPHSVKETSDVKRNRAQLPSQLIHDKPTKGDWLKKRYIVNNYIMLDTLGTGSYGEVSLFFKNITYNCYDLIISIKRLD